MALPGAASLLNLSLRRPTPLFMQAEAAECGLASLAMVARQLGVGTDLDNLRRRFPISARGMTLKAVVEIGDQIGLAARAIRVEIPSLREVRRPAILHWDMNHFVVLTGVNAKGIWINDPARGACFHRFSEVDRRFTGIAVEFIRVAVVDAGPLLPKLKPSDLWQGIRGLAPSLATAMTLALAIQMIGLILPLGAQIVIDHAIPKGDIDLLLLVALGLVVAHVVSGVSSAARGQVLNFLGSTLSFQILGNVFRHTLSLPIAYFAQRRLGDITARYNSAKAVTQFVTQTSVSFAIDALTGVSALVAMLFYSPALTGLSLLGLALSITVLAVGYRHLYVESYQNMEMQVRESSLFMETIRAIQPIKLFGQESMRFALWQNALADVASTQYRLTVLRGIYGGVGLMISAAVDVAVLYISAKAVIDGSFTVGMMTAFASWRGMFSGRASAVTQTLLGLQGLRLNLDRLGDIVRAEPERIENAPQGEIEITDGRLTLQNVSFRYTTSDPWILEGIDLEVAPGELIAITGPSGGGKTTLVKVMLGLLIPSSGEIVVDDTPISQFGIARYRRQVGAVMQDDQLLAGSIADNITFFDQSPDDEQMKWAASVACIDADIARMPMGYHSLIGEMGASLSGGQKQRVLLARALYRRPKLLFMDEGTSALDVAIESRVSENIKALGLTRVIVAHRPETIRTADRVVTLHNGRIAADHRRASAPSEANAS